MTKEDLIPIAKIAVEKDLIVIYDTDDDCRIDPRIDLVFTRRTYHGTFHSVEFSPAAAATAESA